MRENPVHIVYLGLCSFPGYLAEEQRARLIAKGLVQSGCKVTFIMRWWNNAKDPHGPALQPKGEFQGLGYIFACGTADRPSSWMVRKLLRFTAFVAELLVFHNLSKVAPISAAIVSTQTFVDVVYYRLLSAIFSFPVILNLVELQTAIIPNGSMPARINAFLLDYYAPRLSHGLLPISEFLTAKSRRLTPGKPLLKVPVLVDIQRFEDITRDMSIKYLLFCGSLGHLEIIEFILASFEHATEIADVNLYLVANGSPVQRSELLNLISKLGRKRLVKVFSTLSDHALSDLYFNAYALLIPLRPTIQDTARFPHKIGEYCASGRPIVTTNYGEIRFYFVHRKNAMIAKSYDVGEYARTINELLGDPLLAKEIGAEGRTLAERDFSHTLQGSKIKRFIQSLRHNG